MKKIKRDSLKRAFDISEPQRKEKFIAEYRQMELSENSQYNKNKKYNKYNNKYNKKYIKYYAGLAMTAFAAVCIFFAVGKEDDYRQKFTPPNITTDEFVTDKVVIEATIHQQTEELPQTQQQETTTIPYTSSETQTQTTANTTDNSENYFTNSVEVSKIQTTVPSVASSEIGTETETETETQSTDNVSEKTSERQTETTEKTTSTAERLTESNTSVTAKTTVTTTSTVPTQQEEISTSPTETSTQTTYIDQVTPAETETTVSAEQNEPLHPMTTTTITTTVPRTTQPEDVNFATTTSTTYQEPEPPDAPSVDTEPPKTGTDYTVTPAVVYEISGEVVTPDTLCTDCESSIKPPYYSPKTLDEIENESDLAVYASITDIIYTSIDGVPYTQENIEIYYTFGETDLKYGDKISLYIKGGYMPAEEYISANGGYIENPQNFTVFDSCGNIGEQKPGELYIFFLKDGGENLAEGAYSLPFDSDSAIFEYRNDLYVSISDEDIYFSQPNKNRF